MTKLIRVTMLRLSQPAWLVVKNFFGDAGRIVRDRSAGLALLALASFPALVMTAVAVLLADTLALPNGGVEERLPGLLLAGIGTVLGVGIAALVRHPRRRLGLVPVAASGLAGVLGWTMAAVSPATAVPCLLMGFMGGLLIVPLVAVYLAFILPDTHGPGFLLMVVAVGTVPNALVSGIVALIAAGVLATPQSQLAFLTVIAGVGTMITWAVLWLPLLELVLEVVIWPFYRIRAHGPGKDRIPTTGPVLIVSNHSAYVDPFWIGKVTPRRATPMMLSVFYDKPVLRWLMRHVVGAIRVEKSGFRREAPELREAIAALDSGKAVLLFPEGILRRKEEQILRPFGRGVWHILHERPLTPVVLCWIEGGWESYASYKDGPPFVNKRLDWGRRIDVAIAEPVVLPAEVLADHRRTREYLWRACLACRRHLGLEVPAEGPREEDELEADRLESRL